MKMNKLLLAGAMAVVMAVGVAGCGSSNDTKPEASKSQAPVSSAEASQPEASQPEEEADSNTEGGNLVMATNAEFPPYEMHESDADGNDKIVGIDVEIAEELAKAMGKELEITDMAFDSVILAVNSGKADFGAAGLTITADRLVNVDFSDTYVKASQMIIVQKDNEDITGPDDLQGKKIGVQLGTTGDIYCSDIEGNDEPMRYNKGFEAVQALSQGKIDAVVIDEEPAKAFAREDSNVKVLDVPFTDEEYAFAVKKGNQELLDQINATLKDLKESGKLDEIINKYINAN